MFIHVDIAEKNSACFNKSQTQTTVLFILENRSTSNHSTNSGGGSCARNLFLTYAE